MLLFLVRHAQAESATGPSAAADANRALTAAGRDQASALAQAFVDLDLHADAIWTSPCERARQTSAAMAAATGNPHVREEPALTPPGDFDQLRTALDASVLDAVVLVGHQPFLGQCAGYCALGRAHPGLALAEATLVCLVGPGLRPGNSSIDFVLNQRICRSLRAARERTTA